MNTNEISGYSVCGINYSVIKGDDCVRPYGIAAVLESDNTDKAVVENLFFTDLEAAACCRWLAENEVYPVTLQEVLENIYIL